MYVTFGTKNTKSMIIIKAWAIAKCIALRGEEENKLEDTSALRILRIVAKAIQSRVDEFKSQECKACVSNKSVSIQ
jgi:hypothetical protein